MAKSSIAIRADGPELSRIVSRRGPTIVCDIETDRLGPDIAEGLASREPSTGPIRGPDPLSGMRRSILQFRIMIINKWRCHEVRHDVLVTPWADAEHEVACPED